MSQELDKKALFQLTYGMFIVCAGSRDKFNGQICNTAIQVTSEPVKISICINKNNLTHQYIEESRVFTVSILEQDTPMEFIGRFGFRSGRDFNKFEGVNYKTGKSGAPVVLDYTLAYLEAELKDKLEVGTHTIFVGEVIGGEVLKSGTPMTYAYYHQVKKGKVPKTAPHYQKV